MKFSVGMSGPDIGKEEIRAVADVLSSGILSLGPRIEEFETSFAARMASGHACAVSSGTAGLHLAVIAAGIGTDDVVITTPFSFIASSNVILYERATPVFVDVDPATGNIDTQQVAACAAAFSDGGPAAADWLPPAWRGAGYHGSLKAILPVHVFGHPVEMDAIVKCAAENNLAVIEDACEALGSEYLGKKAGGIGNVGVFAFYPNKQMTTAEGGMIVTDDEKWDRLFRSLRNQGRDEFNAWLKHKRLGYNYRMDEMSAALGSVQLSRLDELLARRERVASWYNERLSDCEFIDLPRVSPNVKMSWFVYVIRIRPPVSRGTVMKELEKQSIPSRPYFSPIHLQPFYQERFGYLPGSFPVAEKLGAESLALPFSGSMSETDVTRVCDALLDIPMSQAVYTDSGKKKSALP